MGYVNAVLTGAPKQYTSSPSISVDVAHNLQNKDKIVVESVSCVYQWNGYSAAIDVLRPFGYTQSLLTRIQQVSAVFYLICYVILCCVTLFYASFSGSKKLQTQGF